MDEETMNRMLMLGSMVLTMIAGLATVGLLIMTALQFSWAVLLVSILMVVVTVGCGVAASFYGQKVSDGGASAIFSKYEAGLLTWRQRQHLKRKRGEVVMERALIEVEHERDNIVHEQRLELEDPDRPPHETQWTQTDGKLGLPGPRKDRRQPWEDERDR